MTTLRSALTRSVSLLALTATLAACNSQAPVAVTPSQDLVSLTLRAGTSLSAAALQPQGVPFNDDGTPAVQSVHVRVISDAIDETGERFTIRFDEQGNQDPNGSRDFIELTPGATTATIRLQPGRYDFESTGLTQTTNGVELAYQFLRRLEPIDNTLGSDPAMIDIHLKTLIGRVRLEPALPLNYVYPGQVFDLNLVVQTPDVGGGKRYAVPLADFEFRGDELIYESKGLEVVSFSQLGERVKVVLESTDGPARTMVSIRQRVYGLRSDTKQSAFPAYPDLYAPAEFEIPLYPTATLGVDLTRPTLSFRVVNRRNGRVDVGGEVDDNVGIAKIQVYEGVVLIGSTDAGDLQAGVHKISVDNKGWSGVRFDESASGRLTAVAQDTSGNEIRVTESF